MFRRSESIDIVRDGAGAPDGGKVFVPFDGAVRPPTPPASDAGTRALGVARATIEKPAGTIRMLAIGVGLALFVAMFWYASVTIHSLFSVRLGAPGTEALLAVCASVGVVFGTLLIALASDKHSVRGLAGMYLFIWLLLTLCLVALEAAARGGLLAVPDSLAGIGRVIAALLAALALVPVITIPIVASHPDSYTSAPAAISSYIGFVAKGVAIAASVFASAYFGISRNMPVEVAVLCGFLLESCFMWSYLSLIKAYQRKDLFDIALWAMALILYGAFIALVSVETISTLAHIEVPLLAPLADAGAVLFVSAVGLSVILMIVVHVLTSVINITWRRGADVIDGNARPLSRRMAERILGVRAGLAEIQAARFEPHPEKQLQFRRAMLAKDAPAREPALVVRAPVPAPGGDDGGPGSPK